MDDTPKKPKGAYSLFLSNIVGDQGLVYAVDLWEEGIMLLEEEIETRGITNIMALVADAAKEIDIEDYSLDMGEYHYLTTFLSI